MPTPTSLPLNPATTEALSDLAADLRRAGVADVRFDKISRILYSTDASIYQVEPIGVIIPRHEEEIVATVSVCAQHGVPVLPRGGGSSLSGQTVGRAVVVDVSRHLDRILEIEPEARRVRCQPGVVLDHLNAALRPHGLMLGPDPASSNRATVGGTVGNNGTGSHSILYGMIADHILATRVVLSDSQVVTLDEGFIQRYQSGRQPAERAVSAPSDDAARRIATALPVLLNRYDKAIRQDFPRHWRRASGYNLDKLLAAERPNLAQLLAGSEGTLAFMTEVVLKVVPRPRRTVLGIVHFDDLLASAEATVPILELGPSAVELMDKTLMDLCRCQPEYSRRLTFIEGDPACVLAVEFYVEDEEEGQARLEALRRHLTAYGHRGVVVPLIEPAAQANVWAVRKVGLGLLLSKRGDAKPVGVIEDVAVPPEHLADYLRGLLPVFAEYGKEAAFYAHASAGCLHIRPLLNLKDSDDVRLIDEIQQQVLELIRPLGGVLSGEHGDGLKHTRRNAALFGPRLMEAFAEVKRAFDPANIFNPGKKVPLEMLRNGQQPGLEAKASPGVINVGPLRYGPDYRTIEVRPLLDWSADGGLARAVEMCNGSADCRKLKAGVMCPSFQATREELHSTRGRANLLRAALSGQLPAEEWTGDAVYQALDLCLGCKACKVECPSSVDMAKIKTEFLAQRYAQWGTPLRAWLFGHIHALNRLAAPLAPLANRVLLTRPARRALGRVLDLHPARPLPPLARPTFPAWFARRERKQREQVRARGEVALFPDTFMTFNYPQIGIAAVRVLEAAECRVRLAPRVCCGRPMLSQGLVKDARRNARRNVELLYPLAAQGLPILVCEPSCTAAFQEEYFALLPDDPRVEVVARQVWQIDDWLAEQLAEGLTLPLRPSPQKVLFHGHCHQKALRGTAGSLTVLQAVPGQQVSQIGAGCCGMAGAFGYTADHYAISEAIARDRLLPAIEATPEALICADGASCRQQIEHFSGRPVHHVMEILAAALVGDDEDRRYREVR